MTTRLIDGPASRPLLDHEVAAIIGSVMASLMTGTTAPETVRRALRFQLENFDTLVRAVEGMKAGKSSRQIAEDVTKELTGPKD